MQALIQLETTDTSAPTFLIHLLDEPQRLGIDLLLCCAGALCGKLLRL